jgi:superfamily II DNA/RNA helicase
MARGPGTQRTEEPLTTQPTHAVPFRDLGVDEVICSALEAAGIYTTFPIQALTLPLAINGQDIIGQARTGTGKTLAFGVPILHRLVTTFAADRAAKQPSALIIVPTRELAIQVTDDIKQAGAQLGARVLTVYGGRAYEPQLEGLAAAKPRSVSAVETWSQARLVWQKTMARPRSLACRTRARTSILSRWCVR